MSNGKKGFIWFLLCVILFAMGQIGKNAFYNGHGTYGSIRYYLLPISEEFMRVDYIIRDGNFNSTYDKDKIIIKNKDKKYEYKYLKEGDYIYIENEFDTNDDTGQLVAKGIIDAVYRINTKKKTLFEKYNLFNFMSTDAKDGVNIKVSNKYQIKINVKSTIIDSLPKIE